MNNIINGIKFAYIVKIEYKILPDRPRHPCGSDPDHDRVSVQLPGCSPHCIVLKLSEYRALDFNVLVHSGAPNSGKSSPETTGNMNGVSSHPNGYALYHFP